MKILFNLKPEKRFLFQVKVGFAFFEPPPKAVRKLKCLVEIYNPPLLISVGDIVSENCFKYSDKKPDIVIIDERSLRERTSRARTFLANTGYYVEKRVKNPPSTITYEAWGSILNAIRDKLHSNKKTMITVDGEEDLLFIPAALLSPENTIVVYGYPQEALVATLITSQLKNSIIKILLLAGFPPEMLKEECIGGKGVAKL